MSAAPVLPLVRWRVVYFIPDPFLGGRVPIAAIVEGASRATVLRVPRAPCVACFGPAGAALVLLMQHDIERWTDLYRLPISVGPQAELGDLKLVPGRVEDPVAWVQAMLDGGLSHG